MKRNFSFILLVFVALVALLGIVPAAGASIRNNTTVPIPKNVKTANLDEGVVVTWDKESNVDGYVIYRLEGNAKKRIARITDSNQKKYVDRTAASGGKYNYTVLTYKKNVESAESKYSRIIHLKTPEISSVTVVNGGILVDWNEVKGAQGYTVYRKDGNKNIIVAKINDSSITSYKDTSVLQGIKYRYTVVAHNTGYKSAFEYKNAPVYVATPKLKSAVNANGYITVSWNPIYKADKYKVYRKTNNSNWVFLASVDAKNSYLQDKDVANGKIYTYTIRAENNGKLSGFDGCGVKSEYVSVPSDITVFNKADKLCVSWSAVENATKYFVYRKDTQNTGWKLMGKTNKATYEDDTVQNGVNYTYTVRAEGSNSGLSWFLPGTGLIALKAPTLSVNCTPDAILLNWSKMSTATDYLVYRKSQNEKNWTCIRTINDNNSTSITDNNVSQGEKYTYTVKQVKGKVSGSYNIDGVSTKFYPGPMLVARYSPEGILLTWSKAPVGLGYEIERMTETDKRWTKCAIVSGITSVKYNDRGVAYGQKNYYRISVTGSNLISYSTSIYGIDPNKPAVALTYDDGPYTPVTNRILDVLEKYDSRATFFVVGSRVNTYADCIRREAALGCEIANHTYNHTILTSAKNDVIKSEIQRTNDAVKKITGKAPTIVRAPGGSVNSRVKSVVGYPLVNWSVDTLDWKNSSGVVSIVKNNVKDGSIVLMHDLYGTTAAATEVLVPWLVNQGYQLVTVTELMELKGIYMEAGGFYTQAY